MSKNTLVDGQYFQFTDGSINRTYYDVDSGGDNQSFAYRYNW
jgi:hypothetical protein